MRTIQSSNQGLPPQGALTNGNTAPDPAYGGYPYPTSDLRPPTSGLGRYLTFLRKKWWLLLLTLFCSGGLAAAYLVWWPVSFVSTAHMWVTGKMRIRESATYDEQSANYSATQVELVQSLRIQERALARLQNVLHVPIPTNAEGKLELFQLKVSQVQKSGVMELKAVGPSETYVRAYLDAVMEEFIAFKKELRAAAGGGTYTSVSEQVTRQETELKAAQDKLTTYMRDNNVAVLEEQAKAAGAYLTQLLTDASRLKLELQIIEATSGEGARAAAAASNSLAVAPDPKTLADHRVASAPPPPEVLGAQQELEKIKIMRAQFSRYFRPKHPKIVRLDEEIARAEKVLDYYSRQNRDQLANSRQTLKLKLEQVQGSVKEWETNVNTASERIAQFQRLKLNLDRVQSLHERLLTLLQNVDLSRSLEQEQIDILDRASEAKEKKLAFPVVIALAVLLGLASGLGLIFLAERLDDRVLSLEDMGGRFDEWIVGQVPEVPRAKKKKRPALLELDDHRHIFAESHRNLRSALLFANYNEEKPKTLLVTSAIPNEGKSTVAANLARAIAFAGSRVLLVDGDMRRGVLHQLFDVPQEPGLSDLLNNGGDLSDLVTNIPLNAEVRSQKSEVRSPVAPPASSLQPTNAPPSAPPTSALGPPSSVPSPLSPVPSPQVSGLIPHPSGAGFLHLLSRGRRVANSGELFLSEKCDRLLARMRDEYDCVIIDSIPVFAADDTTSLAPKMDGVLFVVRGSFARTRLIQRALGLLYERQARVLGLVYNRANAQSRGYDYYKYAAYHRPAKNA
jgi:polysaccharide biosynthesis transport protein